MMSFFRTVSRFRKSQFWGNTVAHWYAIGAILSSFSCLAVADQDSKSRPTKDGFSGLRTCQQCEFAHSKVWKPKLKDVQDTVGHLEARNEMRNVYK